MQVNKEDYRNVAWIFFILILLMLLSVWLCFKANAATTIADMAQPFVGEQESKVVAAVCLEIGAEEHIDPWLIAVVWRYENGFHKYSKSRYYGGLQLSHDKLKHFSEYGLDSGSWKDQIRFGVKMWRNSANHGKSLWTALQPWGVRSKAIRLYKSIVGDINGWHTYKLEKCYGKTCG